MATEHILSLLAAERDKLDRAIAALGGSVSSGGRPDATEPKIKRKVGAAARRKMAAAQKKRWAALKAATK
jgi:hypothetical protein